MSNASKSFTSMQATRSHRRDVNGMVGQWSTFNQMRTFLREICVPLQPADPLKLTASAALQNGLMFQPHSEDELFQMSNWTGRPKVRKHGGMAQSVGHLGRNFKPTRGGMAQSVGHLGRNFKPKRGGMAQSVEHIVHIDGVVGSSPTVTTTQRSLRNQASLSFCSRPGVLICRTQTSAWAR